MAWAGTTTQMDPLTLVAGTIKVSTDLYTGKTTQGSTEANGQMAGAVRLTTDTDVVHIPFNKPDGKMVIFGNLIAPDTSIGYVAIALRYPESSDGCAWRSPVDAGSSTEETGWKLLFSTNFAAATSQAIPFVAGPFESAKYGHNFGGTSSNSIDKYQPFLEVMFMVTTAATQTFLTAASSSATNCYKDIVAFELP